MAIRQKIPYIPLDQLPYLNGRQLEFESIAQMLTVRSNETPNAPHVYYYDQTLTYQATNDRANKVANYLKEKGVKKGDIVAVMISNSPEFYYALWGTHKLGAIAMAVPHMLRGPEIAYILDDAKPKVAFVGSDCMNEFFRGLDEANSKPVIVEAVTGDQVDAKAAQETLVNILDKFPANECLVKQSPDDVFLLLYSSGTTGRSKGILLSNKAALSLCRDQNRSGIVTGNDVMLLILPMFHCCPLCVFTYPMCYAGQALCIRQFSVSDFWPTVIQYEVTIIMAVPTMIEYILNRIDPKDVDMSKVKIKYANTGAGPLSLATRKRLKEQYNIDLLVGYGLTEGCGGSSVEPPLGYYKEGSCGLPYPEQQIEIIDEQGNILPNNKIGEICIKGDNVMSGYLNKADEYAKAVRGGFLHTGDVGYFDEEGYLFVTDRKGDMIIRGGENIYPREIEHVLEANRLIAEVAIIGVPDKLLGEKLKAYIVPKVKGTITPESTKAWLAERIADFKIPDYYEFVSSLPRTATGKIQKNELRKRSALESRDNADIQK
ncbi:class I adenylate-forming enzyme family protein [Sporomusa acidovorans]|uniref:Long-chain-fatty-acid--CoA ligase n=1 Tax=Sporomusa acidovorans (strain ATCC 49682 / DSM 3132 / Mol) TaxID=1123286 RepID=A0ABZ3J2Y8_SPOA4|nr:class I adenylate-forming enzyme family protein [Sporomusa acidovorans]OZC23235.1 long-chain-fatty-acid--CoA ligase [Sporomusa acidovorans DSM 3132]SDE98341.1 long-chain acyl-CoA synthetase [Sporomusa acidovorans]